MKVVSFADVVAAVEPFTDDRTNSTAKEILDSVHDLDVIDYEPTQQTDIPSISYSLSANILGTIYRVDCGDLNNEKLAEVSGLCDGVAKVITIRKPEAMGQIDADADLYWFRTTLYHELVHAFIEESGFDANHAEEELFVTWITAMHERIDKVHKELMLQYATVPEVLEKIVEKVLSDEDKHEAGTE